MADSIFKQIGALVSAAIKNTKTELETKIDSLQTNVNSIQITPLIDAYTKAETDAKIVELAPATDISGKADKSTTLGGYGIIDAYTKTQIDTSLSAKANKGSTISAYGITDVYTKTQVDTSLTTKQATLVSGTNIKTIFGSTILGSGDITVPAATSTVYGGVKVSLSGTTLTITV